MSDEPLYCTVCGAEDWNCEHAQQETVGPYCEICGVIPAPGYDCSITKKYCKTMEEVEKIMKRKGVITC